jgi:hypothetical protein
MAKYHFKKIGPFPDKMMIDDDAEPDEESLDPYDYVMKNHLKEVSIHTELYVETYLTDCGKMIINTHFIMKMEN